MANAKIYREKKELAYEFFLQGKTSPAELASLVGISPVTAKKWIKAGHWDKIHSEERALARKVNVALKKALIAALHEYERDPQNTALQSLVSLIRSQIKKVSTAKEINEYIVTFLDQTTDYMIEHRLDSLLKQFQPIVIELAEYLRVRNK